LSDRCQFIVNLTVDEEGKFARLCHCPNHPFGTHRPSNSSIGAERGWGQTNFTEFAREVETGSLYVGAPETVARKIAETARTLGISRFDLKYSSGTIAHETLMRSIDYYGRDVITLVGEILALPEDAQEGDYTPFG
jgi:hypothetical protein